jgi:hypothetical protein
MPDVPERDLLDGLRDVDVRPLPPSEIRARGDRLRRRRTSLAVLGAAASVAVVAGVIGVVSSPGRQVQPAPAPATTSPSPSVSSSVAPDRGATAWTWSYQPDFPLDVDQTAMEGDGGEMRGPSPDETGLREFELCGQPVWSEDPAERLASTATGPEYADIRELRVYPTADEASESMTALRDLANSCTPSGSQRHLVLEADTGYDTVTWGLYYTEGLGGGPVQFTRVGRAIFAVALQGEYSEQSLGGSQEQVTEMTLKVTPAMCVFTEAGCGDSSDPEDLVVSAAGAGPFALGMSSADAKLAGARFFDEADQTGRCSSFTWEPDNIAHLLGIVDPDEGIVSLSSTDDRFYTPEGVGIGSTFDEVRTAYPDATGDRGALVVDLPGDEAHYLFDLAQQRVARLTLAAWSDEACVS